MSTISGKHVVILGSAMGLGEALYQQFELGNLPVSFFTLEQIDWANPKQLEQQILKPKPNLVVNALPLELLQSSPDRIAAVVACTQAVAQLCQTKAIKMLQFSSASIFADNDKKAYDENEKPLAKNDLAKNLLVCEQALQTDFEQWMLLRLAWVINTQGDNFFTRHLRDLISKQVVEVDPSLRCAPIWLDDALRVSGSMVRQLLAGAENWGVFHYGSADPCSEREFVQQLADSISELQPNWSGQVVSIASDKQQKISTVLKCRRVRNNFGVHGRTWRQGLKARIQFWLDSRDNTVESETLTLSSAGNE